MNLFEDSDGEQGNYIKIETEVINKFDYRQMHEVFCLSSQTVLDWKVSNPITEIMMDFYKAKISFRKLEFLVLVRSDVIKK